jgi:DNA-binding response OmpR family regulator
VARATLVAALYPETGKDRHRALDAFVRRTRERLVPLGLEIHTVRGIGYLLEVREIPG